MCSMVKLICGTTEEIMMPSTCSGEMWLCANRFISRMPYSSEDMLRSVDTRQYCTISMPSKSAVLMLVFPMSRVSIMGTYSFENDSCFILRSASTTGVVIRALATASS